MADVQARKSHMKRKIIILFIIILLGRILFLSFYKNPEEINFKKKFYAMELTRNSNLPMQLMEKVDFSERESEEYSIYSSPYSDFFIEIPQGTDMVPPCATYDPDMYIICISICSNNYNVLGLSIGDDLEEIEKTMKQYGYIRDIFVLLYLSYKKGDIYIDVDMSSDNQIEEIAVYYLQYSLLDILGTLDYRLR